nr:histone deacetylase 14 [Tanacetum cinerariifolium]
MADANVNAHDDQAPTMAPPTRTDDQIMPHIRWVPIGKSNCYLDIEKSQSTPIYKITMDILKHTNFFRAFTASSTNPSIYIQQSGILDALQITPINNNKAFSSPPSSDVERIWEEFTQSIHTFIEDKKNLAQHTHEKRKATLIIILSIRYLKFSAKGTKREVFGMPIPHNLITADIQGESYYQEYLAKVAKHQRYLAGETGSDPNSPAPKPTKTTKKSKPSGKKRKLVTEISNKPSPARKSRPGLVSKRHKSINSLRALEESLKSIYDVPRGPLPPMVIREPEHTSTPTGSSGHDESSSLYVEFGLTDSEVESDEDVLGIDAGVQGKGQAGLNPDDQDEGQAGPNPNEQAKGQAGPNPGDVEASQPLLSPVVHAGSDLEHIDLDVADISTQPHPE